MLSLLRGKCTRLIPTSVFRYGEYNLQTRQQLAALTTTQLATSLSFRNNHKQSLTKPNVINNEWRTIYHLPIVRWASAFNRLKIYQGAISIAGIPAAFMLEASEILPAGIGFTFATIGISGFLTLVLSSLAMKNLIGFIYINREQNKIKFAYVDYFGRRKDVIADVADVVPDSAHVNPSRTSFFHKISLENHEKLKMKLLYRFGVISHPDLFNSLFY